MGQKIHPLGFRMGIRERWRSRWNADKRTFPTFIREDYDIRNYLKRNYFFAGIPRIDIERSGDNITIIIHTARPGILIGRKGKKLEEIQADVEKIIQDKNKRIQIQVAEVNRPEHDGQLVAESVREQLEKRQGFRRVVKKTIQTTMNAGAKGIRIRLAGRLGGSEMARTEQRGEGTIPLHTLDADISYGFTEAKLNVGHIGVKVWIYRGRYGEGKPGLEGGRPRRARQIERA